MAGTGAVVVVAAAHDAAVEVTVASAVVVAVAGFESAVEANVGDVAVSIVVDLKRTI